MNKPAIYLSLTIGGVILAYYLTRKTAINQAITTGTIKKVRKLVNSISDYGRNLIKQFESLQLHVYNDAAGFSIGYGHYLGTSATVKQINQSQADAYFAQDIANVEQEMHKYITAPLTQNQHDALVSFFYNNGHRGFVNKDGSKTKILLKLNALDYVGAANEFDRWRFSNGVINTSLVNRRAAEKALYLS